MRRIDLWKLVVPHCHMKGYTLSLFLARTRKYPLYSQSFFNGPFLLSDQRVAALLLLLLQRHGACASGRNVKGTEVMHSVNRYWQY